MELDHTDKRILKLLQEDAKMSIKEIASALNITTTPTYERIKKMERAGYIEGYAAIINRKSVGLNLMVICNVTLDQHQHEYIQQFEQDIKQFKEVRACYHTAGVYDYLIEVHVTDMKAYQDFISNQLSCLPHIGKVQSSFIMKSVKESHVFHIPD